MLLRFLLPLLLGCLPTLLMAYPITTYLEMVKVTNVGNAWKNVPLSNNYNSPVVACTYNIPSKNNNEGSVRVRLVGSGVQVKVQRPLNSNAVTASNVYCTISEEGSYTLPIKYEAHTVTSDQTNKKGFWQNSRMENVTASKVQNYSNPVITGQVMSYNNPNYVTFWSSKGSTGDSAVNGAIYVGKHTGEIAISNPTTETLGYFIAEEAEYTLPNAYVKINLGADSIRGVKNAPPYQYNLPRSYRFATATISAMDGGDGGWAVLYGANPVSNKLNLAIDEDTVSDSERSHTTEEVAYWVMEPIVKTYADLRINEVMYRQTAGIGEFIEFTVLSSGTILNYVVSSQDGGTAQDFLLPDVTVNVGDYVVLHTGIAPPSTVGNVHHVYTQKNTTPLRNAGDDVVLLKPSSTDATQIHGSIYYNAIPVDYIAYGSGGNDPVPVSVNGVTVNWNNADKTRLGGVAAGQSISLTPNATDSNTSVCWEKTTSGDASACPGFIITRDTDSGAFINSQGKDNTSAPLISLAKTVLTVYDPFNGASNPKAIPGSVLEYSITASNNGSLAADNNSIQLADIIPANTKLCVSNTGHCLAPYFANGSSSGLSWASNSYSANNGADNFGHPANPDAEGADASITNLRADFNGAFQPKIGNNPAPKFSLKFRVIVQ